MAPCRTKGQADTRSREPAIQALAQLRGAAMGVELG